jgi:predicted Zn finger-like uncharacterized protein
MKFLCGSCRTKYQISDEKVRGKILTIRCKKCGAKIIVREALAKDAPESTVVAPVAEGPQSNPAAAISEGALSQALDHALASGDTHDVPLKPEAAADLDWYLAIDGQQSGPFPFSQILERVRSGLVQGRHYVWHEGMENWTRVRDTPGLQEEWSARPSAAPPPPPPPAATGDLQLGNASPLDPSELPTTATASTLFGDGQGSGSTRVEQAATQVVPAAQGGSLDELLALGNDQDLFANVPRATEADLVPKESTRFFVKAAGVRNSRSRNRMAILFASLCVVLIVGVVGSAAAGWITFDLPGIGNPFAGGDHQARLFSGEADDPESVEGLLGSDDPKGKKGGSGRRRARPSRPRRSEGGGGSGYIFDEEGDEGIGTRGLTDAEKIELGGLRTEGGRDGRSVVEADLPGAEVDVPLPSQKNLSEKAIQATINARKRSVQICYQRVLKAQDSLRGKLEITVRVEPSGRVSKSVVQTPKFRGSRIGRCIADKIKEWRFPAFEGEAQEFSVPFVLERSSY